VNCRTCAGREQVEIASKTIGRDANGITRCHRLECGHAWHVAIPASDTRAPGAEAPARVEPAPCNCGEIATVNRLLAEGRQHEALGDNLGEEAFRSWLARVLEALDGIPAESGAPSLVRSAATAAKSATSSMSKKLGNLNKLLGRAIKAVS
jgi:hypothetical protein